MRKTAPLVLSLAGALLLLASATLVAGPHPAVAGALVLLGTLANTVVETVTWRRQVVWTALRRLQVDATLRAGLRDVLLLAVAGGGSATGAPRK